MGATHSIEDKPFAAMSRLHEIALLPTNNQHEIKQLSHLINKKCKEGYTPLALAVYKKGTRTENIAEMLNLGADANTGKGSNGGVLHVAANTGRVDVVKLLLSNGADPNSRKERNANPVVTLAKTVEIVKLLLACGANVNQRSFCGWSVLHFASADGRDKLKIAQFLLANGFCSTFDVEKQREDEDLDELALSPLSETALIGDCLRDFFRDFESDPQQVLSTLAHLTLSEDDLQGIRDDIYKQSRHFYLTQNPSLGDPSECFDVRVDRVLSDSSDTSYQDTDNEEEEEEDEEEEEPNSKKTKTWNEAPTAV